MGVFLSVMVAGILTDNLTLSGLIGFDEATKPENSLLQILKKCGFASALVFLSTLIVYPLTRWVLNPLGLEVLTALLCVLVLCGIVFGTYFLTKKYLPAVYAVIDGYQGVITCSVLTLGCCLRLFGSASVVGFGTTIIYSLASMIGFLLVSVIFWCLRDLLNSDSIPKSVRGLPLTLLLASLLSMAFEGFSGI